MNSNAKHFELLVSDLQTEISQLQREFAAVSEYYAELQQQQRDTQEELSSVELEERLLTKQLKELLGPNELLDDENENHLTNNKSTTDEKETAEDVIFRIVSSSERDKALQVCFQEETKKAGKQNVDDENNSEERHLFSDSFCGDHLNEHLQAVRLSKDREMAYHFVFGTSDELDNLDKSLYNNNISFGGRTTKKKNSFIIADPSKISLQSPGGALDYSEILSRILQEQKEAQEVTQLLQKQKEFLMSKMQQCGAISVALEAMMLYRMPNP
jgi:hypothetical protein